VALAATALQILATAKAHHREVVLPVDAVVAKAFKAGVESCAVSIDAVGADDIILDGRSAHRGARDLGVGAGQDGGVERPLRRLRAGTVRHRHH
jgi:hypothetical protein